VVGWVEGEGREGGEGRGGGFGCRYLRYFGVVSGRGDGESVRVRGMSLLLVKGCKGGGFGTCGWYAWVIVEEYRIFMPSAHVIRYLTSSKINAGNCKCRRWNDAVYRSQYTLIFDDLIQTTNCQGLRSPPSARSFEKHPSLTLFQIMDATTTR